MERAETGRLFPAFLKLTGRSCTVVGGGEVALRKVRALLRSGARVRIVAPRLCASLEVLVRSGDVEHIARGYRRGDLAGSALAFGATDDPGVNEAVYEDATRAGVPVNVVDQPKLCSFYVPAVLDRGPIQLAVSTAGTSPALARRLRGILEDAVPREYGDLANLLGSLRSEAKSTLACGRDRAAGWQRILDSEVLSLLRQGREEEARRAAREALGIGCQEASRVATRRRVRIGTRGSALATAQAAHVAERLEELGAEPEIAVIRTTGDREAEADLGGIIGAFVREIEQALADGDVDLAVHSMKDLPTIPRAGLVVAAVPQREDPSDVIVTRSGEPLCDLPSGSRMGTSSPRRAAQLRAYRPDLLCVPVRGNVDTRLRKLRRGDFDALVLAYAGLARLGRTDEITERLPVEICTPAPGQGALALQVREQDEELRELLGELDHWPSRLATEAERAFLVGLGGGCSIPAGALAMVEGDALTLKGALETADGTRLVRDQIEGPMDSAAELGAALAARILAAAETRR